MSTPGGAARDPNGAALTSIPPRVPDTYWLLEGATLLLFHALGGLFVKGEENVPPAGPVLLVSNHVSFLDPPAIGDACPRRVVFMAKHDLFRIKPLGFVLRGVDAFAVKRGEADRQAFKSTLAMLEEERVVCIFPEGTRRSGGVLGEPEPGAAVFALRTGCPVVPVFVEGSDRMLDARGRFHRGRVTVAFGASFTFPRGRADRDTLEASGRTLMEAIARTRDTMDGVSARRIRPHWTKKVAEGSRTSSRS